MAVRRLAVLSAVFAVLLSADAGTAFAEDPVVPRPGLILKGQIKFPRAQNMYLQTGAKDGSRLTVALGFHGKCKGGGLSQLWAGNVAASPQLRVREGRFEGTLTGVSKNVGGVSGRSGHFKWEFSGRFTARDVAVGTVTGTAEIRSGGKTISRCKVAESASVRLTVRAA